MEKLNYEFDKKRFEMFLDAIIAIVLTILILELRVPETDQSASLSTKEQLRTVLPSFLSYFGSFLLIVGLWLDHHRLFLNIKRITKRYILLNMLWIFSTSVIPFTTAFAGHHYNDQFAVALLFSNYFVMNIFFAFLYWYAHVKGLLPKEYFADNKFSALYSNIGMIGLMAAIPLAYVNTLISFILGIIIFIGHLLKKK